jgi:peptidoglycan/xylan/chitin deacetylase (PgdA/CDA1 family)
MTANRIVNFHSVRDAAWFDDVISFLRSKYTFVDIESLYQYYLGRITLENSCHITVDDGHKSFYDVVFPVLKRHRVPASIYVSPRICEQKANYWFQEVQGYDQNQFKRIISDMLGVPLNILEPYSIDSLLKTRSIHQIHEIIERYRKVARAPQKEFQNMTVQSLKEVERSGLITIGAHTISHPVLRIEDDANSQYEISQSVSELSNLLNRKVEYFTYPNGIPALDFAERERRYLRAIGIRLALTSEPRNLSITDDPTVIPRFAVSDGESRTYLGVKLALSRFWSTLMRLKPNGEYRERLKLGRTISAAKAN